MYKSNRNNIAHKSEFKFYVGPEMSARVVDGLEGFTIELFRETGALVSNINDDRYHDVIHVDNYESVRNILENEVNPRVVYI